VLAINFGRKYFQRVLIFRPQYVYGDRAGNTWCRNSRCASTPPASAAGRRLKPSEIQGTWRGDARASCHIDDLVGRPGDAREG
jgi:hypothetical protein